MEFRILGPLEVVEDGDPVALGTLKERLVLGVLLLHANEFVSRDRLIDDLWGEAPPATARKAVNVYLSKLRKALGVAGADPISTAPGGYRLHVEPESLDSSRMQILVAEAQELVANGEPEAAADRFREALGLWRGPALAGLQLESRGRDEVAALDELRLTALMDRIDCDLSLGRHEQALTELNVLVREHPFGERLRAQQMLALYRAGRQADALDAYAEARQALVDDLGIEPSEALQRLQQAILRHDPSLESPEGIAARNGHAPAGPEPSASVVGAGAAAAPARPRRRRLALAGIALLGGAAVAAAVRSTSAGASPHVVPNSLVRLDRGGKVKSVNGLGFAPQQIAVAPGAVWVDGLADNTVARFVLRTHALQSIGTPPSPFNVVADAHTAWVSSLDKPDVITAFPTTGGEKGWGPLNSSNSSTIPLPPPGATGLAFGSGYLWAIAGPRTTFGEDDRLWLINPGNQEIVRALRLGHGTFSLSFGDGAAWIGAFANVKTEGPGTVGASWLVSVKPGASGPRIHDYRLETAVTAPPLAVAVGYGKVWVLTCGYCNAGGHNQQLIEFSPGAQRVVKRIPIGRFHPDALAVGAGSVWIVDRAHASLIQFNPKTYRRREFFVGNPKNASICAIAAGKDALWAGVGERHCEDD